MLTKIYCQLAALLCALKNDQRGVTSIEYAVVGVAIAALVAGVFSGTDAPLAQALREAFDAIADTINGVSGFDPTPEE